MDADHNDSPNPEGNGIPVGRPAYMVAGGWRARKLACPKALAPKVVLHEHPLHFPGQIIAEGLHEKKIAGLGEEDNRLRIPLVVCGNHSTNFVG